MESKFETLKSLHSEAVKNYEKAIEAGNEEVAQYFHEQAVQFFKLARNYQ